jgi:hypothetical protein
VIDIYEVVFEIYIEDELVKRQTMRAPREFLLASFVQLAKQIKDNPKPMRVKMIYPVLIWDPFDQQQRILDTGYDLRNKAMDAWIRDKEETHA